MIGLSSLIGVQRKLGEPNGLAYFGGRDAARWPQTPAECRFFPANEEFARSVKAEMEEKRRAR